MVKAPNSAEIYTDFQGLTKLKAAAGKNSPEALRQVAQQFEALFMQMMLKGMREAGPAAGEGLGDSDQTRFYMEMHDQQLALHMAGQGGMGLADLLVRQLSGKGVGGQPETSGLVPENAPARSWQSARGRVVDEMAGGETTEVGAVAKDGLFDSPQVFLQTLYPYARQAAAELGVDAEVLLAQAALETGWGRSVIRQQDGGSTHNLFNIKADGRWDGATAHVTTLEYEGEMPVRRSARFRAYASYADSFADYVRLIKSSPRYAQALEQAGDGRRYVTALHRAGYATDPDYSMKIIRLMSGGEFRSALVELKNPGADPLT